MSTPDPAATEAPLAKLTQTPGDVTRRLAAELASGDVRLLSFPDVAARAQHVLEDPRSTPSRIGKVLGADAALAARVPRIANSAMFNPSGKPVTDLPTAVGRLGFERVRCAARSFAMWQTQLVDADSALRPQLPELWRKGTLVVSTGYAVVRETRAASPDEALVTGLRHNVGRPYLLLRARALTSAAADTGIRDPVSHDWHACLGLATPDCSRLLAATAPHINGLRDAPSPRAAGAPYVRGRRLLDSRPGL